MPRSGERALPPSPKTLLIAILLWRFGVGLFALFAIGSLAVTATAGTTADRLYGVALFVFCVGVARLEFGLQRRFSRVRASLREGEDPHET